MRWIQRTKKYFPFRYQASNILIDKDNQSALLADFGLARIANPGIRERRAHWRYRGVYVTRTNRRASR